MRFLGLAKSEIKADFFRGKEWAFDFKRYQRRGNQNQSDFYGPALTPSVVEAKVNPVGM